MPLMQSKNLWFEPLTAAHADELFPVLVTPSVLAFIDSTDSTARLPTCADLKEEYAIRARGPLNLADERWFNMAVRLKTPPAPAIGRLEATGYGEWGEVAYLFGEAWWGRGLAFEAMFWWHNYLAAAAPQTVWWAAVHPANDRSRRLLAKLGYEEVEFSQAPNLRSYDAGDRCFVRSTS